MTSRGRGHKALICLQEKKSELVDTMPFLHNFRIRLRA